MCRIRSWSDSTVGIHRQTSRQEKWDHGLSSAISVWIMRLPVIPWACWCHSFNLNTNIFSGSGIERNTCILHFRIWSLILNKYILFNFQFHALSTASQAQILIMSNNSLWPLPCLPFITSRLWNLSCTWYHRDTRGTIRKMSIERANLLHRTSTLLELNPF